MINITIILFLKRQVKNIQKSNFMKDQQNTFLVEQNHLNDN